MPTQSNAIRVIPLLAGGVPLLVGLVSYWISLRSGHIPACNVFWDGCVSISAAGRQPPAVFLFKGGFLPAATVIALYWWLMGSWLVGDPGSLWWSLGSTALSIGPCAGTLVDLSDPEHVASVTGDGEGRFSGTSAAPAQACGAYLQAVDLETCQVTNVGRIPR